MSPLGPCCRCCVCQGLSRILLFAWWRSIWSCHQIVAVYEYDASVSSMLSPITLLSPVVGIDLSGASKEMASSPLVCNKRQCIWSSVGNNVIIIWHHLKPSEQIWQFDKHFIICPVCQSLTSEGIVSLYMGLTIDALCCSWSLRNSIFIEQTYFCGFISSTIFWELWS